MTLPQIRGIRRSARSWRRKDGSRGSSPCFFVSNGRHRRVAFHDHGDRAAAHRRALEYRAQVEAFRARAQSRRDAVRPKVRLDLVPARPERGIWRVGVDTRRANGSRVTLYYYQISTGHGTSRRVRIRHGHELAALERARALRMEILASKGGHQP